MIRKTSKLIPIILSISCIFSLMSFSACKPKTVDITDYPVPIGEVVEDEEAPEEEVDTAELNRLLFVEEPDPIKEDGRFVYSPTFIPAQALEKFKDHPNAVRAAKLMMEASAKVEEEVEIPEDLRDLPVEELEIAYGIAYTYSPIAASTDFEVSEDGKTAKLSYFKTMKYDGFDDDGNPNWQDDEEEKASKEEARKEFETFVDYVTDTINDCVTKDSTDEERARSIYEKLVKDFPIAVSGADTFFPQGSDSVSMYDSFLKDVNDKEVSEYELTRLYSFFLTQLRIENYRAFAGGLMVKECQEMLPEGMMYSGWNYIIIALDGKYYNCDLIFESVRFRYEHPDEETEPVIRYFAISDDKFRETIRAEQSGKAIFSDYFGYEESQQVPKCPENLVKDPIPSE